MTWARVILAAVVVLAPLGRRAWFAGKYAPQSCADRHFEHVLTSKFVAKHYDDETVVVNDVGAVGFYTRARLLDMYGLSSNEPMEFRKQAAGYTAADVHRWTRSEGASIAVLQVDWNQIHTRIPDDWVRVAHWYTPRNVAFGGTRVGLFAVDASRADELALNLRAFTDGLPQQVRIEFEPAFDE